MNKKTKRSFIHLLGLMKKKENPEVIYTAALEVFARFGFKKTTMEEIARQLDMTKGNLYLYAKNKQSLYRDTAAWALRRWQAKVAAAVAQQKNPTDKFHTLCRKAIDYLSRDRALHELLINDPDIFPMFPDNDPFERVNADSVALIENILVQGIRENKFRSVDVEKVSRVIFMIYKLFIIQIYIKGKETYVREMLSETVSLMTQGLFLPPASPASIKGD